MNLPNQSETTKCEKYNCWSAWTDCSVTCGEIGHRSRSRTAQNGQISDSTQILPIPTNSFKKDKSVQREICVERLACEDPRWSAWTDCQVRSDITPRCGETLGRRERVRTSPCYDNLECISAMDQDQSCELENVLSCPPVWSEWTTCTEDCGSGVSDRYRQNVHECFGDVACENELERKVCNSHDCLVIERGSAEIDPPVLTPRSGPGPGPVPMIAPRNAPKFTNTFENTYATPIFTEVSTIEITTEITTPETTSTGITTPQITTTSPPQWSSWSNCPSFCGEKLYQTRQNGISVEKQICLVNIPCDPIWSEWSACESIDCKTITGTQKRSRTNNCFGNYVCENFGKHQNQTCETSIGTKAYINACVPWSEWSDCDIRINTCQMNSEVTRKRERLTESEVETCYDCEKPLACRFIKENRKLV